MNRFNSERAAKEFLVGEIVSEAARKGQPLTDIERKMLYFSETGWTLPDMAEVNDAFDQQYDQGKYEGKIARLARSARTHAGAGSAAAWSEAVNRLAGSDHYLSVMLEEANDRKAGALTWRSGLVLVAIMGAVVIVPNLLVRYVPHRPRPDDMKFFEWVTFAILVAAYFVVRVAVGRRRFDAWMNRTAEWVVRGRRP